MDTHTNVTPHGVTQTAWPGLPSLGDGRGDTVRSTLTCRTRALSRTAADAQHLDCLEPWMPGSARMFEAAPTPEQRLPSHQ